MCSIWGPDIPIRPILGTSRPTKDQLPPRNILTKAKWIHCKKSLRVERATEAKFLFYAISFLSKKECRDCAKWEQAHMTSGSHWGTFVPAAVGSKGGNEDP